MHGVGVDPLLVGVGGGEQGAEGEVLEQAWDAAAVLEEQRDGIGLEEVLRGADDAADNGLTLAGAKVSRMSTIDQTIATYFKAWNALTREEIGRLVESTCSPSLLYVDPLNTHRSSTELADRIHRDRLRFPGFKVDVSSALDGYDQTFRYTWRFEADRILDGLDVVTCGPDGRIAAVTSFFGPLGALEPGAPLRVQARWGA